MENETDLAAIKLEIVRDITVAYLNNVYPKPLITVSEDARQKTIEQHRNEISDFMKAMYSTVNKLAPAVK